MYELENEMKIFILSLCIAVVFAIWAGRVLNKGRVTAYQAFATSGTWVGDPGHNLVGPNWSGLNRS